MFPVLVFGGLVLGGSAVVRYGVLASMGAMAAAREKKHKRAQTLDLNDAFEKAVNGEMGRDEAEFSPVEISPDDLPPSLKEFAGKYLLTPRDIVVLTLAVTYEKARTRTGRVGSLVKGLAKLARVSEDALVNELYNVNEVTAKSLPALLRVMQRTSQARMRTKKAA